MIVRSILAATLLAFCPRIEAFSDWIRPSDSTRMEARGGLSVQRFAASGRPGDPGGDGLSFAIDRLFAEHDAGFAVSLAETEQRVDATLGSGPVSLGLFAGTGSGYSRLDRNALAPDPYFFHGGAEIDFTYRGLTGNIELGQVLALEFAVADVDSGGLERRRAAYAGMATRHTTAGVFAATRGGDVTAGGVAFGFSGRRLQAAIQQVSHQSGARHRALGIGAAFQRGRWFDLQVQSGRNPLYRDGDETRITFRFGSLFGRAAVVRAADTVGGTDGAAQSIPPFRGARAAAMIGGAVVGVALASSSGSDRRDSAPRMTTRDVAARSIVGAVNPRSVRENREYGGWLYRNADGTYGHTGPIAGTVDRVDIGLKSSVPRGTLASATWHTHGGPDPRYNNEEFSTSDLFINRVSLVDGYLGTPAGWLKRHDHRDNRIVVLGRIPN